MNTVGGPVGGMPMMNNGISGGSRANNNQEDQAKTTLNTYIYDYFLKNELYDCARALVQSDVSLSVTKASPGLRRDADGNPLNNGVDENSMDTEIKEEADSKRPDDLPVPKIPTDLPHNSLLQDWWCLFWDVWSAQRKKNKPGEGGTAVQYLQYTQQQQRLRQEQNQQILRQINPALMQQNQYMIRLQNGMEIPPQNQLPRKAIQNSRVNATPHQMQMAKNQSFIQHLMQRGNSNMGMNGEQRPQSPSSAENAPSPSKRPRLENGPFQSQPVGPAGRGQPQGMPGQPMVTGPPSDIAAQSHHLLLTNGITQLSGPQYNNFQQQHPDMQQKNLQVFSEANAQTRGVMNNGGLAKGMPNPGGVPNQGSPMMPQGSEGQAMNINMSAYYEGNQGPPVRMNGPGQAGGNALQDYQLQLMLLEQQNKKRLLMARAEQDGRPDQSAVHVQQGLQGMSPQGPRSGPSPNPQEQMNRRGSPKMNQVGMPGSPLPDGSMAKGRGSPTAMGLHHGQVPHPMAPGLIQEMAEVKPVMVGAPPNGAMMRPPSSHPAAFNGQQLTSQQLDALARAQAAGRMPQGQSWQQAQHMQQAQQQQVQQQIPQGPGQMMQQPHQGPPPQPAGTPQPRNAMPPPPPNTNGNGRTQPSSPQQNAAPPTPQQTNKPNPKSKKESKGAGKRPIKKGTGNVNAGATPSSEAEPPPTPTTPMHTNSFSAQQGKQNPPQIAGNSQAPPSAPIPAPPLAPPPPEPTQVPSYPGPDNPDGSLISLEFAPLDTGDVFNSIDFEAFLRTDDGGDSSAINFDMGLGGYGGPDGLEAGTGDV